MAALPERVGRAGKESTLMSLKRPRVSMGLVLAVGVLLGWLLASFPRSLPKAYALGADRWGDWVVASGPVSVRYDERLRAPLKQDALYYLDYRAGRLLGTIPSYQQSGASVKLIDTFTERDLVADFKIDLDKGPKPPHFVMTTCEVGAYSMGWAPLFVFETESNQVATYRIQQQTVGTSSRPMFELIDLRAIAPSQSPQ
jgi:hypothetical protein